jgi:hypothetical protein
MRSSVWTVQTGSVAKSYKRKGFLIRKYLVIFEEAVSQIVIYDSRLNFLIYEENLFPFITVYKFPKSS